MSIIPGDIDIDIQPERPDLIVQDVNGYRHSFVEHPLPPYWGFRKNITTTLENPVGFATFVYT